MSDYVQIDREGQFRGRILEHGLVEGKTGSVNLSVSILCTEMWDPDNSTWDSSWEQYGMVAEGFWNLVKVNGQANEIQVRELVGALGWDGLLESLANGLGFATNLLSFAVKQDTYNGNTKLRARFIAPFNSVPHSKSSMQSDKARSLDSRVGPQIRAIASTVALNSAAPSGQPQQPKPAERPAPAPMPTGPAPREATPNDGIPF